MTDEARRERRLAAILMLDVAGFSEMMGRDDQATTSNVVAFHGRVGGLAAAHRGRVVKTAGDSVFAEFESIVEAVECAAAIQRAQVAASDGDRFMVRIGLHLGDVIVQGDDLFGEGVNIAARLEPLAEPGGIAVSEAVYLEVGNRPGMPFEDGGVHRLKNIDRPVRVYRVAPAAFGYAATGDPSPTAPEGADLFALVSDIGGSAEKILDAVGERLREKGLGDEVRKAPGEAGVVGGAEGDGRSFAEIEEPVPSPGNLLIGGGFLMGIALGVFLILARTTGWTTNAVYPFLGCVLLGMSAGSLGKSITRRRAFGGLLLAAGLVVGGLFLGSPVGRVFAWIAAAAALGGGLRRLGTRV
ncbi:MAG: hypothetical protein A2135_04775 [Actinobacteria bacterium RBG_16_67_15]|nr:MAG: hypothetical protein A2135_04775 [Actinobacteria bacterium RBG_16_67_15]